MSLTTRAGIIADTDCVGLWEVDTLTGFADNDPVGAFPDASGWVAFVGGTKQMQQGTGTKKPLYKTNQRNGLPALSFDGTDDYLESSPRQATSASMVLVRKLNTASPGANKVQAQMGGTTTGLGVYQSSASPGKHSAYLRGVVGINSTTNTTTNWEIVVLVCGNSAGAAGNTKMFVDGTQVLSTTDDMANINSDVGFNFIGRDDTGTLMSGAMLVGAFAEFKRKLSDSDVADITNYFKGLWGDIPGTPTALDVANETGTTLDLSWSAPVGGGTVSSYEVRVNGGSASTATSPHTFTGLTPGTTYTLEVRAVGPGGNGAWASIAGTTYALPGVPTAVAASGETYETIDLSWSAPASGGPVTSYQVRIDGGTPSTATSPHTFTGLTPGTTYTLEVRAVGPGGDGAWASVTADTLDDTVTEGYLVELRIGGHTWSILRGDTPDPDEPNPLAGAVFSWGAPDDCGWPPRPWMMEADTVTVRVWATDADGVDDIRRYDVMRFAFTPAGYGALHPLVDFAGLVTQSPKITRHPQGVLLEVTAVDYRAVLQLVTIFGRAEEDDGGGYNGETDAGTWNVAVEGEDGRELIQGVPAGVTIPGVGLVAWNGVDEWINNALGFPAVPSDPSPDPPYGLPWIDFPLDIFDGADMSGVAELYRVPTVQYETGQDMVTLHDVYKTLSVYPWPTWDVDGTLTGFLFVDPHPAGADYTLTDVDGATVLGAVEWRRGVHPDWLEVRQQRIPSDPTSFVWVRYTTGENSDPWPDDLRPEVTKRVSHATATFGDFNTLGFVEELPTASWFPYKLDVVADLDPTAVDGWFNYPERVSKVVRVSNIEDVRHPDDPHPLTPAEVPADIFIGRLSRASLTIAAQGRWSVTARLRPRLHGDILTELYPP